MHAFIEKFEKPTDIRGVVETVFLMAEHDVLYHFDDDAVDCLATPYEYRPNPPMTEHEAVIVSNLVEHMWLVCEENDADLHGIAVDANNYWYNRRNKGVSVDPIEEGE